MMWYTCEDCEHEEEIENGLKDYICSECGSDNTTNHNSDDYADEEASCHSDSYWD